MSPDSASCRHMPSSEDGEGSLLGSVAQSSPPLPGKSPPSLAGPELAREQQGHTDCSCAASLEKLLIQGSGEPGDCRQLGTGQQGQARPGAAGSHQGPALAQCPWQAERPAAQLGSRARLPRTPPCCHCRTPHTLPLPLQDRAVSTSPRYVPPTTKTLPWGPHP